MNLCITDRYITVMCQVNSVLKNSAGAWNVVGAQRGGCSHNDWFPFSCFITFLSFTFLFYYYYYLDTRLMAFLDLIPNPKLLILYYILVLPECCLYHIVPRAQHCQASQNVWLSSVCPSSFSGQRTTKPVLLAQGQEHTLALLFQALHIGLLHCSTSSALPNNSQSSYSPIYRWRHWGCATSDNMPTVTWVGSSRMRIKAGHLWRRVHILNFDAVCFPSLLPAHKYFKAPIPVSQPPQIGMGNPYMCFYSKGWTFRHFYWLLQWPKEKRKKAVTVSQFTGKEMEPQRAWVPKVTSYKW